jgi:hypothetical protein
MIEVISPAGFEGFFRELADLAAAGPPALDTMAPLAAGPPRHSPARWRPRTAAMTATLLLYSGFQTTSPSLAIGHRSTSGFLRSHHADLPGLLRADHQAPAEPLR